MKDTDKKRTIMGATVSNPATDDLRGRQSVRATFRLSEYRKPLSLAEGP